MVDIINSAILVFGLLSAGALTLGGMIVGALIMFPRFDPALHDRWIALFPIAISSALGILGLALTKWAIWVV